MDAYCLDGIRCDDALVPPPPAPPHRPKPLPLDAEWVDPTPDEGTPPYFPTPFPLEE